MVGKLSVMVKYKTKYIYTIQNTLLLVVKITKCLIISYECDNSIKYVTHIL